MAKKSLTDEEVEMEIMRLRTDGDVKLAKTEQYIKYRRRQYLYALRCLKKRGAELRESGVTAETLQEGLLNIDEI